VVILVLVSCKDSRSAKISRELFLDSPLQGVLTMQKIGILIKKTRTGARSYTAKEEAPDEYSNELAWRLPIEMASGNRNSVSRRRRTSPRAELYRRFP
jgi:hypothetical protein